MDHFMEPDMANTIIVVVTFLIMDLAFVAAVLIGFSDNPKWTQPSDFAILQGEHAPWMLLAVPGSMVAAIITVFNDGEYLCIPIGLTAFCILWFGSFYLKLLLRKRRE